MIIEIISVLWTAQVRLNILFDPLSPLICLIYLTGCNQLDLLTLVKTIAKAHLLHLLLTAGGPHPEIVHGG